MAERSEYGQDKYGNPTCSMPVVEWADIEPGSEHQHPRDRVPCGAELYLEWTFTVPIGPGEEVAPADVAKSAISSGWQVICTNGHTLRFSNNGLSATDDAEPCDFDLLFPTGQTGGDARASEVNGSDAGAQRATNAEVGQ